MNEEEMIYYEDELLEELSKNKLKRTDILINLNVALQKYQRIVASIKDFREIQKYKIAVVSIENELKDLQQENQKLKNQLQQKDDIINKAREHLELKIIRYSNETNYMLDETDLKEIIQILDNKGE